MNESRVLVHVWQIEPAEEAAAVARLNEMFREVVNDPGFIAARILESADQASLAVVLEMRTVEDRQRLEQLPAVRETLQGLHGSFSWIIKLYREVGSYGTAGSATDLDD